MWRVDSTEKENRRSAGEQQSSSTHIDQPCASPIPPSVVFHLLHVVVQFLDIVQFSFWRLRPLCYWAWRLREIFFCSFNTSDGLKQNMKSTPLLFLQLSLRASYSLGSLHSHLYLDKTSELKWRTAGNMTHKIWCITASVRYLHVYSGKVMLHRLNIKEINE